MKINVVGTSGSGKSTLSKHISNALNIPHIEMDYLFWKPNWTESTDEEFNSKLEHALAQESWVLDGNFTRTTPIKWKHVDLVVWVDFSYPRTLLQAFKRALVRATTKVELWEGTGNKESFKKLFTKDSIILWTITNYKKNKQKYQAIMNSDEYAHIRFVRVKSPKEASQFIAALGNSDF
ncbi:adenylate kinase [Litoribrevibacter euphylliae]|uniref:Adenylate kinase n=1 Tax=Litoribrevibacter euphylliae TaxID=1834034 RepID=A0ABV7HAN6_9GAMM